MPMPLRIPMLILRALALVAAAPAAASAPGDRVVTLRSLGLPAPGFPPLDAVLAPAVAFLAGKWRVLRAERPAEVERVPAAMGAIAREGPVEPGYIVRLAFQLPAEAGGGKLVLSAAKRPGAEESETYVFEQRWEPEGDAVLGTAARNVSAECPLNISTGHLSCDAMPPPQALFPWLLPQPQGGAQEAEHAAKARHFTVFGCQLAYQRYGAGAVPASDELLGYEAGPVMYFADEGADAAVLSHARHVKNAVGRRLAAVAGAGAGRAAAEAVAERVLRNGGSPFDGAGGVDVSAGFALGLSGELDEIPAGSVYRAALVAGKAGLSRAARAWGREVGAQMRAGDGEEALLLGGTDEDEDGEELEGSTAIPAPRPADITLSHLGFFTDNGAQLYGDSYNAHIQPQKRGHGRALNLTCCSGDRVYQAMDYTGHLVQAAEPPARESALARRLRYLQLDDWWYTGIYPQGWGVKCVEDWEVPEEAFSGDRAAGRTLVDPAFHRFKKPLMLYNPFFCANNSYAVRSARGNLSFPLDWVLSGSGGVALPRASAAGDTKGSDARALYALLFADAARIRPTFAAFEVDFLNLVFLEAPAFRRELGLWERGLLALDQAAAAHRPRALSVQLCMMLPADLMIGAVLMRRAASGRASDDYAAIHNWDVGHSSLLFGALKRRKTSAAALPMMPSKDNLWTTRRYPADANFAVLNEDGTDPGANTVLHAAVALLSGGPVGASDVFMSAREGQEGEFPIISRLLSRLARADGLLLRAAAAPMALADSAVKQPTGPRVDVVQMAALPGGAAGPAHLVLLANSTARGGDDVFLLPRSDLFPWALAPDAPVLLVDARLERNADEPPSDLPPRVDVLPPGTAALPLPLPADDAAARARSPAAYVPWRLLALFALPKQGEEAANRFTLLGDLRAFAPRSAQRFADAQILGAGSALAVRVRLAAGEGEVRVSAWDARARRVVERVARWEEAEGAAGGSGSGEDEERVTTVTFRGDTRADERGIAGASEGGEAIWL